MHYQEVMKKLTSALLHINKNDFNIVEQKYFLRISMDALHVSHVEPHPTLV